MGAWFRGLGRGIAQRVRKIRNRVRQWRERYLVPWLDSFRAYRKVTREVTSLSGKPVPARSVLSAYVVEFMRSKRRPPPPASGQKQTAVEANFPQGVALAFTSDITGQQVLVRREELIGEGDNSVVYGAFEIDPERGPERRALKIYLKSTFTPEEPFWEGINKEAFVPLLLSEYNSPDRILEHQRFLVAKDILSPAEETTIVLEGEGGNPDVVTSTFLLFPRMEGTLTELLTWMFQRPPPPPEMEPRENKRRLAAKLSLMFQVLQLVKTFHHQGLVHGDLKTKDFLVASDGTLYLGHFMRVFAEGDKFTKRVEESFYNPYATPEMLRSGYTRKYTFSMNAWQTGYVLYQIWCLKLPFGIPRTKPATVIDPRAPINMRMGSTRLLFVNESNLSFDKCDNMMPLKARALIRKLLRFSRLKRRLVTQIVEEPAYKDLEALLEATMDAINEEDRSGPPPGAPPIYDEVDAAAGQVQGEASLLEPSLTGSATSS